MPGSMPPPFLPPGAQPQQSAGGASAAAAEPGGLIVDGPIAQLLEANYGILNQFRANMAAFKVGFMCLVFKSSQVLKWQREAG